VIGIQVTLENQAARTLRDELLTYISTSRTDSKLQVQESEVYDVKHYHSHLYGTYFGDIIRLVNHK
jgi:hypothetical protein